MKSANTVGICQRIETAETKAEVQSLVREAEAYDSISEKTLRRAKRIATRRLAYLGTK